MGISLRYFKQALLLFGCAWGPQVRAQQVEPKNWSREIIEGPSNTSETAQWRTELEAWRQRTRAEFFSADSEWDRHYKNPKLLWTQKDFVQPQAMAHDRYLYDEARGFYTVDRYLRDLKLRYGGIDSVLIWPTYPNLGVDDRNQYDLTRDLPGGLVGLRQMIADFHRHNVKVLLPLNPWDNGTRDEGLTHAQAIAKILSDVGADGFNGDTMSAVDKEYFNEGQKLNRDLVIEPELGVLDNLFSLGWNLMSWGYWVNYQFTPGVDRYKWVEPRHMTHVCRRESHDRTDELQYAWFNGAGFESWENIWGAWNGLTARDGEILRRMSYLYRHFAKFWTGAGWQPHVETAQPGVFASMFPGPTATVWSFVNRTSSLKTGFQFTANDHGQIYFDLWRGAEITPIRHHGLADLSFDLDADGFGAILAIDKDKMKTVSKTLAQMHSWAQVPISQFSSDWRPLEQKIVMNSEGEPTAAARALLKEDMVFVPAVRNFEFKVSSVAIEKYEGGDFQYPWESSPRLEHRHVMAIDEFYIDRNLVTNREYKIFLEASGYWPKDDHNFLRQWVNRQIPPGGENLPVTWVSIEDARAYAAWAGKRLPHEWEWQYAAQGSDGRIFTWGNDWNPRFVATPINHRGPVSAEAVGLHPDGASPFGALDMIGNVWQWTDEYSDAHTRAAVLRGGSRYRPAGSDWYFPSAPRLDQHGKYLLMAPSLDRSGAIGFRCVRQKSRRSF